GVMRNRVIRQSGDVDHFSIPEVHPQSAEVGQADNWMQLAEGLQFPPYTFDDLPDVPHRQLGTTFHIGASILSNTSSRCEANADPRERTDGKRRKQRPA